MAEHSTALRLVGDLWQRIADDIRETDTRRVGEDR
jgi:hypothetical protein